MGQRGKFLLSKVPIYMFWRYHLINKFNNNNLYFKSRIIYQIIIFLLRKDIYYLFYKLNKKKSYIQETINIFNEKEAYVKKSIRNFMRKIFYSQLKITRCNSWFILYMAFFTTDRKKHITLKKANESFFRLKHLYHYLTPAYNKF